MSRQERPRRGKRPDSHRPTVPAAARKENRRVGRGRPLPEERQRVLDVLRAPDYHPLRAEELANLLRIPAGEAEGLKNLLRDMENAGEVMRTRSGGYAAPEKLGFVVGKFQATSRGFGFILPDVPGEHDVRVSEMHIGGAMHGDRVVGRLFPHREEGEVLRVIERAHQRVVGLFVVEGKGGRVLPDDRRLGPHMIVDPGQTMGARPEEKVVMEITRFPERTSPAHGRVVERIGLKGQSGVDVLSIAYAHGLPASFPPEVLKEAEAVPDTVQSRDLLGRWDLRDLLIVTIDGEESKDLDDAVSLEREGNLWRLGVHIADVAYYVREGTALDLEARDRATSVYLVDQVIPMLPQRLSNGICSLNPRIDRLTLSLFMDFDENGRLVHQDLHPAVIRTAFRLTYNQVNAVLQGERAVLEELAAVVPMLRQMDLLKGILSRRRQERGSVDFDLVEAKVKLDAQGRPLAIEKRARTTADQIIEEFMLAANEAVARRYAEQGVPFLYRIHEEPEADRLGNLAEFLAFFGIRIPKDPEALKPSMLQEVLRRVAGRPEERLVSTVVLRSMRRARYTPENQGHFGLAAPDYTHFTSPIRRYPDLMIHRIIRESLGLGGRLTEGRIAHYRALLPEVAGHASDKEREADEAERDTVNLKKVEFMKEHEGARFSGVISGVTSFGFFVELDNTVEGLVRVKDLPDDFYQYVEERHALVGDRTRRTFQLGDPVEVVITQVNVDLAQIDFALAESPQGRPARPPREFAGSGGPAKPGPIRPNLDKKKPGMYNQSAPGGASPGVIRRNGPSRPPSPAKGG